MNYFNFQPDVIVEATSVCDRKCLGCYAPNFVNQTEGQTLLKTHPSLFLKLGSLNETLLQVFSTGSIDPIVSVRGGEPSRHPAIGEILSTISQFTNSIFLETHGRWILKDDPTKNELLRICATTQTSVKVSFDQMHGLSVSELKEITQRLSDLQIRALVAITESTEAAFLNSRNTCDWLNDDQIIFQKKVINAFDLVKPSIGVIGVDGKLKAVLNTRASFADSFERKTHEVAI